MKTIAIDFDGVIHKYTKWCGEIPTGLPIEGAKDSIQNFLDSGFKVVIFSTRPKARIEQWLRDFDFPAVEVSNGKPLCMVMIDDRSMTFNGKWNKMLIEAAKNFQTYWE